MTDDSDEPALGSPEQRLREARKQARIAREDLEPDTPQWHQAQAAVEHCEEAIQAIDGGPRPDGGAVLEDDDASAAVHDRLSVTYQPTTGPHRRLRLEPRATDGGMWHYTEVWTGCQWRTEGREPVDVLTIEREGEAADV